MWGMFTICFDSKGPSAGNTYHISKITKKRHWFMGGLYVSEISFVQLIG